MKFDKFKPQGKKEPEKLETYLLAADNPVGKEQLRPFFKRKRSGEVLTREQVFAIKRGRKLLRKEMRAQGMKRRIDFEITATNMGLYFDRNKLFWPFFLWLIRDNTVLKVLATTAVITTAVTVSVPVVEYIQQIVTEYIEKIVEQIVQQQVEKEVDRFTISLSDEMLNSGFTLSETIDFENASTNLVAAAVEGVPCISIRDIPLDVNDYEGRYPDDSFFAYTFYCRYESTVSEPIDYDWSINITREDEVVVEDPETLEQRSYFVSDAIWVMVFEDNEMLFYAKVGEDGEIEALPAKDITDRGYEGGPHIDHAKSPEEQYEIVQEGHYFDYYRVKPINYVSETVVAKGRMENVLPFDISVFDPEAEFDPENPNGIHKYTVVIWLEGDDPECTDALIGGSIGMNFSIKFAEDEPEEETPEEETPGEEG
ncbi:MAG: hypothetical protein IJE28_09065 [Oscillospiraceae bacterium]|nr:hypothetical protein [Oscillospiraceae bacterium]MBQ4642621.1 hypothetical protein [Oscillospiraceae bacterium]